MDSRPETLEHIEQVRGLMGRVVGELVRRMEGHDRSKLASPEVEVFDEFTPKLAGSTYGSDEYRSYLAAMKPALDHHYAANSHHPEHYRWNCGVCGHSFSDGQVQPFEMGGGEVHRVCPLCCAWSVIWECELMDRPEAGMAGMSLVDLIEMICDWKAATLRHADGDIRRSIEVNQKRFGYGDELKRIFVNTIDALGF